MRRFLVRSPAQGLKTIRHPAITKNYQRSLAWRPKHKRAVLLPCASKKPFSSSPSHAHGYLPALEGKPHDRFVVSEPLGVIPYAWEGTWPNNAYDFPPKHLRGAAREELVARIATWWEKVGSRYERVFLALPEHHRKLVTEALELAGVPAQAVDVGQTACLEAGGCPPGHFRATSRDYQGWIRRRVNPPVTFTAEEYNTYLTFTLTAVLGGLAQADSIMKQHGPAVRSMAKKLRGLLGVPRETIYRGILVEPEGIPTERMVQAQAEGTQFSSWSADRDVACWFADRQSAMSAPLHPLAITAQRPRVTGWLMEIEPGPKDVLFHHSWADRFPAPTGARSVRLRDLAALGASGIASFMGMDPREVVRQTAWNLETQREVILGPVNTKVRVVPHAEAGCPPVAELDRRLALPGFGRNPPSRDEVIRDLERRVAAGDQEAAEQLRIERMRAGSAEAALAGMTREDVREQARSCLEGMTKAKREKWTRGLVAYAYERRRDREVNPEGDFDRQGRWYPSDREDAGDVRGKVRSPSATWPYSYMQRARTKKHVLVLVLRGMEGADVPPDIAQAVSSFFRRLFQTGSNPPLARNPGRDEAVRRAERAAALGGPAEQARYMAELSRAHGFASPELHRPWVVIPREWVWRLGPAKRRDAGVIDHCVTSWLLPPVGGAGPPARFKVVTHLVAGTENTYVRLYLESLEAGDPYEIEGAFLRSGEVYDGVVIPETATYNPEHGYLLTSTGEPLTLAGAVIRLTPYPHRYESPGTELLGARSNPPPARRSMDVSLHDAERRCAAGLPGSCGELIRARIRAGVVNPEHVRWADALLWTPAGSQTSNDPEFPASFVRIATPFTDDLHQIVVELFGPPAKLPHQRLRMRKDYQGDPGPILWHVRPELAPSSPNREPIPIGSFVNMYTRESERSPINVYESDGSEGGLWQLDQTDMPESDAQDRLQERIRRAWWRAPSATWLGEFYHWHAWRLAYQGNPMALAWLAFLLAWNPLDARLILYATADQGDVPEWEGLREVLIELNRRATGGVPPGWEPPTHRLIYPTEALLDHPTYGPAASARLKAENEAGVRALVSLLLGGPPL